MNRLLAWILAGCLLLGMTACTQKKVTAEQQDPSSAASEANTPEDGAIHIEDGSGEDITAQVIELWEKANQVYNVDDTEFFQVDMAEPVLLFDDAPAYFELTDYDALVDTVFTAAGKAQLEQTAIGGPYGFIQKVDGKVYRMGPWKTGVYFGDAITGANPVSFSADTVVLNIKYAVRTFGDETRDGDVKFTVREVDGSWLVEDYTYPEAQDQGDAEGALLAEADGPVPDFLNAQQQSLYRQAKTAFMEFTLDNGCFGSGGGDGPELELGDMWYYKANGSITTWEEFESAMLSVFTKEYFEELNAGASYTDGDGVYHERTIFAQQDGDLYYSGGGRGGNMTFVGPETFELLSEEDNEIRFYVVGAYYEYVEDENGDLVPDDDGEYLRVEEPEIEKYTMVMEQGANGWRFSEFHLAY